MCAATFGYTLLVAMIGEAVWGGAVVKLEERKSGGYLELYQAGTS